jgi:hypothetical protein
MDIARSAGVNGGIQNPSVLKKEIDLLRNDVHNTKEPYDLHMMDVIGNINDNYVQLNDHPSPSSRSSHDGGSTPVHREYQRLEPLYEAFVCPLTKQVMRDPVTLESGQTYERVAIERWLEECRENGREPVCPITSQQVTAPPKPSIALRNTIEEWTARNDLAHIDIATNLLSADSSESDVLYGLKDLQQLCRKNKSNKYRIRNAGLLPLIVERLKNSADVRIRALRTLHILAEDDDDNKVALADTDLMRSVVKCLSRKLSVEREEAVALLYELSKSPLLCELIGAANGAILILVGMTSSSSENVRAAELANQTLSNLEGCDNNVREMAQNGRLQPLLTRLVEGPEEVRVEMAEDLANITLTTEAKARAAEATASVLVEMLRSSSPPERASALKALCSLSSLDSNGDLLIEAGVLPLLMRDLFVVGTNTVPMKLKETSAATLANVVCSSALWENIPIDADSNTLTSEVIVHNFLHLISNTGPAIESKLLQILVGLTSKPQTVNKVVSHIKSAGATVSLIQFLEAPQNDLRVIALKLLYVLSSYMGQELADGLRLTTRQLGTLVRLLGERSITEEQAYAAGLLANLPMQDHYLTRALLSERALPILVGRIEEVKRGVVHIGAGRNIGPFQKGLVCILSRFTYMLDDDDIVDQARELDFTALFTSLLRLSNLEEVQQFSAQALENLSVKSKELSRLPDMRMNNNSLFGCFTCGKEPPPPTGLCLVHGGLCSARDTFCLVEAQAIGPLVACLDHRNTSVVEAAMGALSTLLMDTTDVERGVQVLHQNDAIQSILVIMQEHRTEVLRQQAVWMVERILRDPDLARSIAMDASVHTALVDAFRYGNNNAKQLAERALKVLNRIPTFSGVFTKAR